MHVDGFVGMDAHTATARGDGGGREGPFHIVALDDDVAGLAHHLGHGSHYMLTTIGARVFGNLTDAGCTEVQTSTLTGSLNTYLGTTDNHLRASSKEGTTTVHIAYDDLRCRQYQSLGISHITAFLQFCHHVKLHLLHLRLAFPDLRKVFLYAALKCRELFFPILKYIVHISNF